MQLNNTLFVLAFVQIEVVESEYFDVITKAAVCQSTEFFSPAASGKCYV